MSFTHLHVHTEYSLLDGLGKVKDIVKEAKDKGMDSLAITDHGSMYGVIDFYKEAKKQGIKPIIGCEMYVAPRSLNDKEGRADANLYHLVLLAKNMEGYENLIKLVSKAYVEGYYYKPRIDIDTLKEHTKGLVGLSACVSGVVAKRLLNEGYESGKKYALMYKEMFDEGDFYLEIQDHGYERQKQVNPMLIKLSNELDIKLIATNDVHYVKEEDAAAHDVLLCVQTGKIITDTDRMKMDKEEFYLKSEDEMKEVFPNNIEAITNTKEIVDKCNVEFEFNNLKLPNFEVPEGFTHEGYLRKLCTDGLHLKYDIVTDQLKERLEYELNMIEQMGYVDYFLIVWDFIKYSKDNDIAVGPGRGSAAGSIVSYCLDITNIDPIEYGLIFERFLNPERVSMPDIDIDFCYERRIEVINYVMEKYGKDQVAQIVTFGTMSARAVIRDVGRALDIPYADVDKIAKMIPNELKITIIKALEKNNELKELYDNDLRIKNLLDMSMKLEGLPRHTSTHAAGVVITGKPVDEYVPLSTNDGVVVTQFSMTTLEELGLLKMDFLGLRTLTVIQNAVKQIKHSTGEDIDIDKINLSDQGVYELISSGKTEGIFQLESAGMKSFMRELKPDNIEDIIAGVSLYRPGPMDFIPKYVKGKENPDTVTYTHDALKDILKNTYGCIVYQEQVMEIVRELGGFSLSRSDILRRAMGKKKMDVMQAERVNFVNGAKERGIDELSANKIYDEMIDFAKYAFNKSHSAAYSIIAYQTAWLKYYYPTEFMAALLTSVMHNTDKVAEYIEEARNMEIEILAPDINESFFKFSVVDGKIRYALSAIKGVGDKAVKNLIEERETKGKYLTLVDFCERNDLNKKMMESLIKAGALGSIKGNRKQFMLAYMGILEGISIKNKRTVAGQLDIFGESSTDEVMEDVFENVEEYNDNLKLTFEKEVLGVYVSGHPLDEYRYLLKNRNIKTFRGEVKDNEYINIVGIINKIVIKYTKNNQKMAFLNMDGFYSNFEVILFSNTYEKVKEMLDEDKVFIVNGKTNVSDDNTYKVVANKIAEISEFENNSKVLWIKASIDEYQNIIEYIKDFKGKNKVKIYDEDKKKVFDVNRDCYVTINDEVLDKLKGKYGEENIICK
ncbi:MAG: DNA polymerase III subunit alpha [Clostridia bacterium]|jgi:DNA polymerase-3 subunit alpha|nr:DNA polymerase III subunit alpha [Clostridia bacterium]